MQIDEFNREIATLERLYEKVLNPEQKKEYWLVFRNLNVKQFTYIIAESKRTCKFFPKIADLEEIRRTTNFFAVNKQEKEAQEKVECKICNSSGVIPYEKEINGIKYQYVARCSCKNAIQFMSFPSALELGLFEN